MHPTSRGRPRAGLVVRLDVDDARALVRDHGEAPPSRLLLRRPPFLRLLVGREARRRPKFLVNSTFLGRRRRWDTENFFEATVWCASGFRRASSSEGIGSPTLNLGSVTAIGDL